MSLSPYSYQVVEVPVDGDRPGYVIVAPEIVHGEQRYEYRVTHDIASRTGLWYEIGLLKHAARRSYVYSDRERAELALQERRAAYDAEWCRLHPEEEGGDWDEWDDAPEYPGLSASGG